MLALLLWVFSIYGFLSAVWHVLQLLTFRKPAFPPTRVYLVVHNGESFIEGLLRRIAAEIVDRAPRLQVVVVDECSEDNTPAIVERIAAREPWLELAAVETGGTAGIRPAGEAEHPHRWLGFDLRVPGGLEAVLPTLRLLCGAETGRVSRTRDFAGDGVHNRSSL